MFVYIWQHTNWSMAIQICYVDLLVYESSRCCPTSGIYDRVDGYWILSWRSVFSQCLREILQLFQEYPLCLFLLQLFCPISSTYSFLLRRDFMPLLSSTTLSLSVLHKPTSLSIALERSLKSWWSPWKFILNLSKLTFSSQFFVLVQHFFPLSI